MNPDNISLDSLPIHPLEQPVDAEIVVPGSKSYTNRALPLAALADGTSILRAVLLSDDTRYMVESLNRLGIPVEVDEDQRVFRVEGKGGRIPNTHSELYVGNAGTAMRFLTALVTLGHGSYTLDGTPRMRQRPILDLLYALRSIGVQAEAVNGDDCPPVRITADGLPGGTIRIPGNKSSQYLSGLLLAAPYAQDAVTIEVLGELISKPFVDVTISIMEAFGAKVEREGYEKFRVPSGQRYQARDHVIEPDATNASYFFAAAAVSGGRVRVRGIGRDTVQGDIAFVDVLEQMGCTVERGEDFVEVRGPAELRGVDVDMNAFSDTMQTLAAIAPFANSKVTIRNIGHTRLQETDRIHAVATELRRLGIAVEEGEDSLRITPGPIRPAEVHTYDDHRMAMSFAITGLKAPGVVILDPACVNKTFPEYFAHLATLR